MLVRDVTVPSSTLCRWVQPDWGTENGRNDQAADFPSRGSRGSGVKLIGLHQPLRSSSAHHRWRSNRRRQRSCNWGRGGRRTRCGPRRRRWWSGGRGGRPYHHTSAASLPLLTRHGCAELRRVYDRWQVLWKDWSEAGRRRGDPCRCRVDDGAAARRCRRRWDQPWCRRRDRARSFRPRLRARKPLLLQPVLLPLRLLPTHPGVLSAGGILSAHTELLERLLPLLLRLLSSGRAPPLSPPVRQRAADPRHPGGVPLLARASEGIKP